MYTIDDTSKAPSLTNPVGAMTFATPYSSVRFDNTLWSLYDSGEESALFDYQRTVPAGGSVTITWSYATGTTVAEVQGDATAARDAMQAPSVAISSPAGGSTVTSSPVTVTGSASAGSGVKGVTVNGIAATLSGGTWRASVALTRGQNTISATATSDAGNTAKASETVTYTPPVVVTPPVPVAPSHQPEVQAFYRQGRAGQARVRGGRHQLQGRGHAAPHRDRGQGQARQNTAPQGDARARQRQVLDHGGSINDDQSGADPHRQAAAQAAAQARHQGHGHAGAARRAHHDPDPLFQLTLKQPAKKHHT